MADLTTIRSDLAANIKKNQTTLPLKDGVTIGKNRFGAVDLSDGRFTNANDAAGILNNGILIREIAFRDENTTGDAAGSVKWTNDTELVLVNETVAGVSSASDIFKMVYAIDNSTLTIVKPVNGNPIGYVKRFVAATKADVALFNESEHVVLSSSGGSERNEAVATLPSVALEATTSLTLAQKELKGSGNITDFFATVVFKDAGVVAGDIDLILKLDSTARGGGVVTVNGALLNLTSSDAQGAIVSSTAITGNNSYANGDILILERDSGSATGFTAAQNSFFEVGVSVENVVGG